MRLSSLSGSSGLSGLVAALALTAACSSGAGGSDGGVHDATVYDLSLDLPDGCPPLAAQANEKHIGFP